MNEIMFKAGYYEWNVFVNHDCFYTFSNEISEEINEDTTYKDLQDIVDLYIDTMNLELQENDKEQLNERHVAELKRQMIEAWSYHFRIKH